LQLLQQNFPVIRDVDSLEVFSRVEAVFKIHVFNDFFWTNDFSEFKSMNTFVFEGSEGFLIQVLLKHNDNQNKEKAVKMLEPGIKKKEMKITE
jgi:hypothetical protein